MTFRGINILRIAQVVAVVVAISWCVAAAQSIPAITAGSRTLVAVEPLLRSLEMGYIISGTHLQVDGRTYSKPLELLDGIDMVDAADIARFLHLRYSKHNNVAVFSSLPQRPDATQSALPTQEVAALRMELLQALNRHRADAGVGPLRFDPIAEQAAQYQAEEMAGLGILGHEDTAGRSPMQRYASMGGRAGWYAENVGWYGLEVESVDAMWSAVTVLDAQMMAERPPQDGHRENILSRQYNAVGIGLSVGPHGLYIAEDFSGP